MYLYLSFGDTYGTSIALPLLEGAQELGTGAIPSNMVSLVGGGSWDGYGTAQARPRARRVTYRGTSSQTSRAAMESTLAALAALIGKRSYLYSSNDGGTTRRFREARILDIRAEARPGTLNWLQIEFDFEFLAGVWNGTVHTAESTTLDTTPHDVTTTNGGNMRVRNAIITVTAAGTNITELGVSLASNVDWHWTGTLLVGQSLVINCGTKRVLNNGADAYSGFALQSGQATEDWLPLEPGAVTYSVHRTGGANSTFKLDYYDGWA